MAILAVILGLSIFTVVQSVRRERLRVAAEVALRERERTLAAILDNTTVFMGLLSPEGMVLSANRASLEFIGGTDDEVAGIVRDVCTRTGTPVAEWPNPDLVEVGFWPGGDRDGNPYRDSCALALGPATVWPSRDRDHD